MLRLQCTCSQPPHHLSNYILPPTHFPHQQLAAKLFTAAFASLSSLIVLSSVCSSWPDTDTWAVHYKVSSTSWGFSLCDLSLQSLKPKSEIMSITVVVINFLCQPRHSVPCSVLVPIKEGERGARFDPPFSHNWPKLCGQRCYIAELKRNRGHREAKSNTVAPNKSRDHFYYQILMYDDC